MAQPLSPSLFAIFASLIEERVGLHYRPVDSDLLGDKLETRALEAGFPSLLDYYYYLRYDESSGAEFEELVDTLVVNETYFFRELDQLRMMVDEIVVPQVAAGQRVRIWSAACATGEEPLTVAMLLDRRGCLDHTDLLASDVNRRALAVARSGLHPLRSAQRGSAPDLSARYLREENGQVRVDARIQAAVRWQRLNLADPAEVARLGRFDVILCRNVIIYFDDRFARTLTERLLSALTPSGVLFVGVSESLLRLGVPLQCKEKSGVFLYQRAA